MFCSTLFCYLLGRLSLRFRLHSVCWYIQNALLTAHPLLNLMKNQWKINDVGSPAGRLGHLWVLSGRHVCDPRKPQEQTESHMKVASGHFRSPESSSSCFKGLLKGLWRVLWTCRGCFWGSHLSSWCCLGNFFLVQIVFLFSNRRV